MKFAKRIAAVALVVLSVSGCGGGSRSRTEETGGEAETAAEARRSGEAVAPATVEEPEVGVTVEGWENPSDLGIIVANQKGFFTDEGLRVWVGTPYTPRKPIQYVSDGTDTFGVTSLPQLVIAKEHGAPVIAIGGLVSKPTAAMIWLRGSGIQTLADLRGKTIAIPGLPFQKDFLADVLARGGLTLKDVQLKSVDYGLVPALMSGQAAAIFGGSWNIEGAKLEAFGAKPVITHVQKLGVPFYGELVMIARKDLVAEKPELVHRFLAAVRHGTAFALNHPDAALRMMEETDEARPADGPKVTKAEVEASLPILSKTNRVDRHTARALVRWMHAAEMVRRDVPIAELLAGGGSPAARP